MKRNLANILTGIRLICGLLILAFPAFSGWYYGLYLLGGFTDAIDGTVARKLGQDTEFGARLDTAADFVFVIAVIIKLVGALIVPTWLIVWIGVILVIKISGALVGFSKYQRFVTVHSIMNKICGVVVFIPPLFVGGDFAWQAKALAVIGACIVATVAAVQEFVKITRGDIE